MWKKDTDQCHQRISIRRNQENLGLQGKKKKLSLGKQGQTCSLWMSYKEKGSQQKLKSKEEQKSFEGTDTQNFQHLKMRQICDDYYAADGTVYTERFKDSDQSFIENLEDLNQNMNKPNQIQRLIKKDSYSTPNERSNQSQSSWSSSQEFNQKSKAIKFKHYNNKNKENQIWKSRRQTVSSKKIKQHNLFSREYFYPQRKSFQ